MVSQLSDLFYTILVIFGIPQLSTSSELLESPGEQKKLFGYREKAILKGISIYFNPGEMIGVMGPSGCGKTTFLDIMTARRKTGNFTVSTFRMNRILQRQ